MFPSFSILSTFYLKSKGMFYLYVIQNASNDQADCLETCLGYPNELRVVFPQHLELWTPVRTKKESKSLLIPSTNGLKKV